MGNNHTHRRCRFNLLEYNMINHIKGLSSYPVDTDFFQTYNRLIAKRIVTLNKVNGVTHAIIDQAILKDYDYEMNFHAQSRPKRPTYNGSQNAEVFIQILDQLTKIGNIAEKLLEKWQ